MLGLVAMGSALAVVYLFVEFVWWSPTTNDRRHPAALGLPKLYEKFRASGAKQLDQRSLDSDQQEGASDASRETDPVVPFAICADKTASSVARSSLTSVHQNSLRNMGTPQATGLSSP
jgi:hypothetical protein